MSLSDSAMRDGLKLKQYHHDVLLYLCTSAAIGGSFLLEKDVVVVVAVPLPLKRT